MKLPEALKIEEEAFKKRQDIRIRKAKDYANEEDCLQNFKKIAQLCRALDIDVTRPSGVAIKDALLKMDRLCNLIFRKGIINPENESVEDTINDLQNYIDLFRECLKEEQNAQSNKG